MVSMFRGVGVGLYGKRLEETLAQASDLDGKLVESGRDVNDRFFRLVFVKRLEDIAVGEGGHVFCFGDSLDGAGSRTRWRRWEGSGIWLQASE
jgi:hypothetical protein